MICVVATNTLLVVTCCFRAGLNSTVGVRGELYNVANSDVDNAKETLILLLELLLVEYLNSQYAVLIHAAKAASAGGISARSRLEDAHKSKLSFQYGHSVRLDTAVVWVCSPLTVATANGSGKPMATLVVTQ